MHSSLRGMILALSAMTSVTLPLLAEPQDVSVMSTETSQHHAEWTRLLQTYVHPSADGVNRFDYAALKASQTDRAALDAYIDRLAETEISALPDDERFVLLANLYNALTIRLIVENYPVTSITRIRPGLFSIGPWKQEIITLEGKRVSLDDIEHEMLRKQFDDPRVHYAVNCASMGCPNLRTNAWEAVTLDTDLDQAARDYINHARGVTIRKDGRLKVSTIYRWFREDFGGNEKGVIDHLLKYAAPELAEQIRANPDIVDHGYDWSLNDVTEHGE